ncbi:hypothetical protein ANN_02581 [Periplaneta americana]|uniref:Uncharacterized protein n=1 Tax=Periplaneta americana TaxID=6978 RepID=A0ABQ8U145_PERAM|nr:hypothetical protein ANN_02581 [Periplaneta americana]
MLCLGRKTSLVCEFQAHFILSADAPSNDSNLVWERAQPDERADYNVWSGA